MVKTTASCHGIFYVWLMMLCRHIGFVFPRAGECALTEVSELCVVRGARERDDIADVLHACDEQDETFETQSEAGMWA